MSLFVPDYDIVLTLSEADVVRRPLDGDGGHQRFLADLLAKVDDILVMRQVTDQELQRAYRYAYDYGSGGYQDRFRTIISAARRSGWQAPP